MNHLAHLLVAQRTRTSAAGALLADALRHLGGDRPSAFLTAVRLHHAVDDFTDAHAAVAASRARLGDGPRHYRGALIDVYYDHCLTVDWRHHADEPLRSFADRSYATLQEELRRPGWPSAPWVSRMIEADWLMGFRHPAGVTETLRRMADRVRRPHLLIGVGQRLHAEHDGLQADFRTFFPELLRHAESVATPTHVETSS